MGNGGITHAVLPFFFSAQEAFEWCHKREALMDVPTETRKDKHGPVTWWTWAGATGLGNMDRRIPSCSQHSSPPSIHALLLGRLYPQESFPTGLAEILSHSPNINPQLACQKVEGNWSQRNNESFRPPTLRSTILAWSRKTNTAEALTRHWY